MCSVHMHLQSFPSWADSKTGPTHKSRPSNVFCFNVVLHDCLVLGSIFALGAAVNTLGGAEHQVADLIVQKRRQELF